MSGTPSTLPQVPADLDSALTRYFGDEGRAFAATLPTQVAELADRWSLELSPALPGARTAYVAPCLRSDGSDAVLRVGFPEQMPPGAADALRSWDGDGSVRLLESDESGGGLLIERCVPGAHLSASEPPDRVLSIGAGLLRRLWEQSPDSTPYLRLSALGERRAKEVEQRSAVLRDVVDPELATFGIGLWRELASGGDDVLLHADFHPRNILAAAREPWLVIDPKPVVGDRAYEPIPLILEAGGEPTGTNAPSSAEIRRRAQAVGQSLDIDTDRIGAWGVARSVDWALFLAERGDHQGARQASDFARAFSGLV